MKKVILASHGKLAKGMKDSVEMLLGKIDNLFVLCAYTDGLDGLEEQARKELDSCAGEQLYVITDVFGGSVNTVFMKLLKEYDFCLISGMNLGMVVQLLLSQEDDVKKSAIHAIESSKEGIRLCNNLI